MRILIVSLTALALCWPVVASEPGQNLTCEDIQLHQPGLRVRTLAGPSTNYPTLPNAATLPVLPTVDLTGAVLSTSGTGFDCGDGFVDQVTLSRFRGNEPPRPLLTLAGRCVDPTTSRLDYFALEVGGFDWQSGRLLLRLTSFPVGSTVPYEEPAFSLCVVEGFRKLSDIYQLKRRDDISDRMVSDRTRDLVD